MKLNFELPEANWLHAVINQAILVVSRDRPARGAPDFKLLRKMRHKFGPGSQTVWLTSRERHLLHDLADYRLGAMADLDRLGSEYSVVQGIKQKVAA